MIERRSDDGDPAGDDGDPDGDEVDEASMDSFPASDPPGWWAGHDRVEAPRTGRDA